MHCSTNIVSTTISCNVGQNNSQNFNFRPFSFHSPLYIGCVESFRLTNLSNTFNIGSARGERREELLQRSIRSPTSVLTYAVKRDTFSQLFHSLRQRRDDSPPDHPGGSDSIFARIYFDFGFNIAYLSICEMEASRIVCDLLKRWLVANIIENFVGNSVKVIFDVAVTWFTIK